MRHSYIEDAWRKCARGGGRVALKKIRAQGITQLEGITLRSRITAVIGLNGAGKTVLLQEISAILSGRPTIGRISIDEIEGVFEGRIFTVGQEDTLPEDLEIVTIDLSEEAHISQSFFRDISNIAELLAPYEARSLSENELDVIRYLTRRNYSAIQIFEIDAPANPSSREAEAVIEKVMPLFKATYKGIEYDNRTMGFGELCSLLLFWRIDALEGGQIVLLDEPDSHLSAPSRRSMIDYLAVNAADKELAVAFTTHAPEIVKRIQQSNVLLLNNGEDSLALREAASSYSTVRELGLVSNQGLLVVVEDLDAADALRTALRTVEEPWVDAVEIQVVSGGVDKVLAFVDAYPPNAVIGRAFAVLDGDSRDLVAGRNNASVLPGNRDPLHEVREASRRNLDKLAVSLRVAEASVKYAVERSMVVDHHDFLHSMVENLPGTLHDMFSVRRSAMEVWLSEDAQQPQIEELITRVKRAVLAVPVYISNC